MVKGWPIIYGIDDSFGNALFRISSPLPYLPYFACGRINLEYSRTGSQKYWKEAHNAKCFLFSLPFFLSSVLSIWNVIVEGKLNGGEFICRLVDVPLLRRIANHFLSRLTPRRAFAKLRSQKGTQAFKVLGMQFYRCNSKFELQLVKTSLNKLYWELFPRVVSGQPQAFAYFKRTVLDTEF